MSTYILTIGVLIVLVWVLSMYTLWRKEHGAPLETPERYLSSYGKKAGRYFRRVGYLIRLYWDKSGEILLRVSTYVFFTLFPKAKKAFEKKDDHTGIQTGPSSYFLMSVSEYTKENKKQSPRRRNKKSM